MYRCEFPGCDFTSKYRTDIHEHHITPKEFNGSNKKLNLLRVCATCHNKIHIPTVSIFNRHAAIRHDSIIITNISFSTSGFVMFYTKMIDGSERIHQLDFWRKLPIEKTLINFKKGIHNYVKNTN